MKAMTYSDAGVDIDAGDKLVDEIGPLVKKTHRPGVLSHLGGYAGLFALDLKKYPNPVIVSTTDGVGTKLKLAFELNQYSTIGQDLVAMCVNDLICCGAEPLLFLDYFATGKLKVGVAQNVIKSIAEALSTINCALMGGETAEMPGFYSNDEFDLAGFAVGAVNRDKVIDGQKIKEGDAVIGLASSGVHSNGFSLVRKILEATKTPLSKKFDELPSAIGQVLLTPTKLYVNTVLDLIGKFEIKGIAHITGGGLVGNVPRIIPQGLVARIKRNNIVSPPIFHVLQKLGNVQEEEMDKVFNRGIGLVLVVNQQDVSAVLSQTKKLGEEANVIGEIAAITKDDQGVEIV